MRGPLGWGILGTGNIAGQFVTSLSHATRGRVVAVGSRCAETADRFAQAHGIESAYGSYEQLIRDPAVEVVYNALPNSEHHRWAMASLAAGKHVLCEKPMAVSLSEAEAMFDEAARRGLVLVEAFMYRCHPLVAVVTNLINEGRIGKVQLVRTSFCFSTKRLQDNVRFRADLAGGSLMDVGCYCIDFARLIVGSEPIRVYAAGRLHESGVDSLVAGTMEFGDGCIATFTCGMMTQMDNSAFISGSDGYIRIPVPWKPGTHAQVMVCGMMPPRQDKPAQGSGPWQETIDVTSSRPLLALEADAFAATVVEGADRFITVEETLGNMKILDEMRRQVGLSY